MSETTAFNWDTKAKVEPIATHKLNKLNIPAAIAKYFQAL
jgi:hypothetical protein